MVFRERNFIVRNDMEGNRVQKSKLVTLKIQACNHITFIDLRHASRQFPHLILYCSTITVVIVQQLGGC